MGSSNNSPLKIDGQTVKHLIFRQKTQRHSLGIPPFWLKPEQRLSMPRPEKKCSAKPEDASTLQLWPTYGKLWEHMGKYG